MAKTEKRALSVVAQIEGTLKKELGDVRKEIAKTTKAISKQNKMLTKSFNSVGRSVKALLVGFVSLRTAQAFKGLAETTDQLGKMAIALGQNVEGVSELAFAFESAGGSTEQFRSVMTSLLSSQRMALTGTGAAVEAFDAFGISINELRRMKPTEILEALADGMHNIEEGTQATLQLSSLFPEQYRNVLNLIRGGGDEFRGSLQAARQAGATVTKEQAKQAAEVNDAFQRVGTSVASVGRELTRYLGPVLVTALDLFAKTLMENKSLIVGVGKTVLKVIGIIVDVAMQSMEGMFRVLEALGLVSATAGTKEQIAAAQKVADAAEKMQKSYFEAVTSGSKAMSEDTIARMGELTEASRAAQAALFAVATPLSYQLRLLSEGFDDASSNLATAAGVDSAAGNALSALRRSLQSGMDDGGSKDEFGQMGGELGRSFAVGFGDGIAEEIGQVKPKIKAMTEGTFAMDWQAVKDGWNEGLKGLRLSIKNFAETVGGLLAGGFQATIDNLAGAFTSIIDGTKNAKQAFKDFGRATLQIIAKILAKLLALKVAKMVLGMADGGVLPGVEDSTASLPVNSYARGGVARSPQLAVFGEGNRNEAFVPLPDNRSIPVTFTGDQASQSNMVNINVYAWDSKDAARGLLENRKVLQQIFTSQADHQVGMRQTLQRAVR